MIRLLFLCSRNACRSQMAEGFARARKDADVEITSAGTVATSVHTLAIKAMAEVGIDISAQHSKALDDLESLEFDVVVALCDHAARVCPVLPGNPQLVNWDLPDPAAAAEAARAGLGSEEGDEAALAVFRVSRDEIHGLVDDLFERGYLKALAGAKSVAELVLGNISDGIIAHDMDRRIFYFNKAAEDITGYTREEVMNRDCHEAFPGGFCGGKCHFCDGAPPVPDILRQELDIRTKSGEERFIEMTIRAMVGRTAEKIGVLVSFRDLTRERRLARRLGEVDSFAGIVGRDNKMLEVFDLVRDLADSNAPVLIQGESGTGKELVAAAIHNEGQRANRLFVPVNCGALPESLLESELFGHVKGAFTGAIRDKKGRFELAHGGTIFLDEIGDIPPATQVRLLRVLQDGSFERVGSERTVRVDVRLISATNKDLIAEIAAGRFREDLYYRLSVVPVVLPPLRERRNDIPLLVEHVLRREIERMGRDEVTISPEVMGILMSYDWPGNVRELQNWIQFALVKCKGDLIKVEHLPPRPDAPPRPVQRSKRHRRRKLNAVSVRSALAETGGNKVEAARRLGVSRATLYRFLDEAGDL
jgi:PAS domain S-box-containing protein